MKISDTDKAGLLALRDFYNAECSLADAEVRHDTTVNCMAKVLREYVNPVNNTSIYLLGIRQSLTETIDMILNSASLEGEIQPESEDENWVATSGRGTMINTSG